MNREQAIEWTQNKFQGYWPNGTNNPAPDGWNWRVKHKPYSVPEFILQSSTETITKKDVYV